MEVLFIFLCVACFFDYSRRKIPNILLLMMLITSVFRKFTESQWKGVFLFAGVVLLWMLVLYPLFKIGALGAGDVKLLGICAGYFPYSKILHFLFYSLLIAAIISLMKLLIQRNTKERLMYLAEYIVDVLRHGYFHLYFQNTRDSRQAGICLAGPVLGSVLLYIGGIY